VLHRLIGFQVFLISSHLGNYDVRIFGLVTTTMQMKNVRWRIENKVLYSNNETNAKVWRGLREQCLIYRVWVTLVLVK
jgi:hypothetical protein